MNSPSEKLYIALCLLLPFGWGILSARVFDVIQNRRQQRYLHADDSDLVTYDI